MFFVLAYLKRAYGGNPWKKPGRERGVRCTPESVLDVQVLLFLKKLSSAETSDIRFIVSGCWEGFSF